MNDDEVSFFISYYFVSLLKYISSLPNSKTKEKLIIKKYKLLSLPILNYLEDYLFEYKSFEGLKHPPISENDFTKESFNELFTVAMGRALSLNYSDNDIKINPSFETYITLSCLFIKNYLDLSVNEDSKKQLTDLIINSSFYKDVNFSIANKLIDDIIFKQPSMKLTKRK